MAIENKRGRVSGVGRVKCDGEWGWVGEVWAGVGYGVGIDYQVGGQANVDRVIRVQAPSRPTSPLWLPR